MGSTSIWHWIILLLIVVLLFGRGKISDIMGDVAKGIKSFKKGMSEDDEAQARKLDTQKSLEHAPAPSPERSAETSKTS